jgi:O-antigen ligase
MLDALLAAGALSAIFALCQYFDWARVNAWLTPHFAPEPHLTVLRQSGRVVGTFSNPNYFGIFCVVLILGCLTLVWLLPHVAGLGPRVHLVLAGVTAALAGLGLVMSGSRTALLALGVALLALLVFAILQRGPSGRLGRLLAGAAIVVLMLAGAVLLVERFPHGRVDYLGRVGGGLAVSDDASFELRLARWRSVIDAWLPGGESASTAIHRPLTSIHTTGVAPATADAQSRDAQRKDDLLQIATAIDAYHRATGAWPQPDALASALVPRYLTSLPLDPSTNQPYADIATVTGYSLMAKLENPADPDFPIYGVGSSPNYLLNGNLEDGGNRPTNWDGIPGSSLAIERSDALYGDRSLIFRGEPDHPELRGGVYQQRYFGRPGGSPFTATVWLKLLPPATGRLDLYANVIYDDGSRADPLTRIPADMSKIGVWQKVSLGILPPSGKTFAFLGIYVVSDNFRGQALLDGFQLVDGPVPLSFAITREAPPSDTLGFNPEAKLRQSPIIGVGPEKGEQGSALDDEYLLYAARYGLIGILLYLALYLGTLALAVRAFLRGEPAGRPLAALVALTLLALLLFNVTAGSFYELQLMAIFWLLTGAALSGATGKAAESADG